MPRKFSASCLYSRLKNRLSSLFSRSPTTTTPPTHNPLPPQNHHPPRLRLFAVWVHPSADPPDKLPQGPVPVQCHSSSTSLEPIGIFSQAHNSVIYDAKFVEDCTCSYNFLEKLLRETIVGAEFDSSARYPPPRCHPGTQIAIIARCKAFFLNRNGEKKICWVVGRAGTGKSAAMQCIAEELSADASAFLSTDGRKDGTKIIVTIAYQLAVKYEPYRQSLQNEMDRDPSLLRASLSVQFNKLIVEPFIHRRLFNAPNRFLIIIDALDEWDNTFMQREFLGLISDFSITYPASPIMWIISSRPEPHITSFFDNVRIMPTYTKEEISIDSDETSKDVQRYLCDEFSGIRLAYPMLRYQPQWPSEHEFTKIATAAGGLFAYASAAIQYIIEGDLGDPASRLGDVLLAIDARPGEKMLRRNNPLAQLDALYERILSKVPADDMILTRKLLLMSNHGWEKANFRLQCNRLNLTELDAYTIIRHLHAVLKVPPPNKADDEPLQYFHKSFKEFLFQPGVHDNVQDEFEQLKVQTSSRVVEEVPDDDIMTSGTCIEFGDYGFLKVGPHFYDHISLSWPNDERFMKTDDALRSELYRGAMLDICDGFNSDNNLYRSMFCFRVLTTRFAALGPRFPYYALRDAIFDKFRGELTKLGTLKHVPLRTFDYAAIGGVVNVQFTSPTGMDRELFDRTNGICKHEKQDLTRSWSTEFQKFVPGPLDTEGDMTYAHIPSVASVPLKGVTTVHDFPPASNLECDYCSRRFRRHLSQNPDRLASIFIDATELCYGEFSILDPDDGVSEWRYRFLHSGRPF